MSKYPFFNRSRNPFNTNERKVAPISKKGSVMFDENNSGIITKAKAYATDYYETVNGLEYYALEDGNTYYKDRSGFSKNVFHVNYIQDPINELNL